MSSLQTDIEARLAETAPDVEVLLAEVLGGHTVRLFIDHPDGVTVALCERVTHLLPEVRERYALEVSSPGGARPLTKPAHFRRFLGRRARVRLRDAHDGHSSFTGELVGATEAEVTIAVDTSPDRDPVRRHPQVQPRRGVADMSREILDAMKALAIEKGIAPDRLIHALEDALLSAYKKQPGAAKYARVEMDPDTGDYRVIELIVPERLEAHLIVETIDEGTYIDPETGEPVEPQDPEIDPAKFEEYRDQIDEQDVTPDDFGRIAAQTAKQVILQRIREAERDMMFEEYRDRVGELITGIVQQSDSRYTLVQLRERVEALLPKSEQVDGERYDHSQRIKAVIKEVSPSTKGPSIIVSRRDPELIKKLFELEVPEIADGLVEIANVAREPGYRSKIAVVSYADGVDPVGACVGPRGSRVRMVVSELRGEKIDIIPYNDEPARFVAKALSPARVREVLVDDDARQATVVVPDDQLSLAIGREGQNARLAARLTGWRIDIKSETEFATEEPEGAYPEEETGGRCAAILGNGRRCPNAALPGSRFCGVDSHQALEGTGTVYVPASLRRRSVARERRGRGGRRRGGARRRHRPPRTANDGLVEEAVAEEAVAEGSRPRRPRATAPTRSSPPPRPPPSPDGASPKPTSPPPPRRRRRSPPHNGGTAHSRATLRGLRAPRAQGGAAAPGRARRAGRRRPGRGRCPAAVPTSATRPARRPPSSGAPSPGPSAARCPLTMTS